MTGIRDIDIQNLGVDKATQVLTTIDYEHHEVHSGSHYTFSYEDADLDATETIEFIITTEDTTKWAHFVWAASGSLGATVEFFEDTTRTTTDTASTSYNNNRNTTDTSALIIQTHSTTDGADGTKIDTVSFGGADKFSGGGTARGGQEWILKQDTVYLFRFTSNVADNLISVKFSWYDHTDKAPL